MPQAGLEISILSRGTVRIWLPPAESQQTFGSSQYRRLLIALRQDCTRAALCICPRTSTRSSACGRIRCILTSPPGRRPRTTGRRIRRARPRLRCLTSTSPLAMKTTTSLARRRTAPGSGLTGAPSAMQRRHRDDNRWAFPLAAPHSDIAPKEALAFRPQKAELHVEKRGRIGCLQAGYPSAIGSEEWGSGL
jgi:hypothetical protein